MVEPRLYRNPPKCLHVVVLTSTQGQPYLYFRFIIPSHFQTPVVAIPVSVTVVVMRNEYRSLVLKGSRRRWG
jgi:hypothetical protein